MPGAIRPHVGSPSAAAGTIVAASTRSSAFASGKPIEAMRLVIEVGGPFESPFR